MYVNDKSKFNYGDLETDWIKLERGVDRDVLLISIYMKNFP